MRQRRGLEFLLGEEGGEVREHQVAHRAPRLDRRASLVRLQHDILHREERRRHVRLVGEDVEPGAAEPPFLKRRDQRRLVDDGAARDVDQDALRPERIEDAAVDELLRLRARRER